MEKNKETKEQLIKQSNKIMKKMDVERRKSSLLLDLRNDLDNIEEIKKNTKNLTKLGNELKVFINKLKKVKS